MVVVVVVVAGVRTEGGRVVVVRQVQWILLSEAVEEY